MSDGFKYSATQEQLQDAALRGLSFVQETDGGCWVYPRAKIHGYGVIKVTGRMRYLHRLVYALCVRQIPPNLHIDHLCRNRACCNPSHLEAVTRLVNIQRGLKGVAMMTHCSNGHPYTEENTRRRNYDGKRQCLTCNRARNDRKYAKKKAKKWASRLVVEFG